MTATLPSSLATVESLQYGRAIGTHLDAYAQALRRSVGPSSTVLDVGGGTGFLSLLACRFGARRVFAVGGSPSSHILLEAAKDNGYADRIMVLQAPLTDDTLPGRADVIVSAVRDLPLRHPTEMLNLIDACNRLAAHRARVLPAASTLWFAIVSAPEVFERDRAAAQASSYGLDVRATLRCLDNSPQPIRIASQRLLGDPVQWGRVDFRTMGRFRLRGGGEFKAALGGTAHGIVAWLDAELTEDIVHSNSPAAVLGAACQLFFPWPQAVAVSPGDRITVDLRSDLIAGELVWTWTTDISSDGTRPPAFRHARQSTFMSAPISLESLHRRAASFAPCLSTAGELVLEVLQHIRAGGTIGDFARTLHSAHPKRFESLDEAHGFVAAVCDLYAAGSAEGTRWTW